MLKVIGTKGCNLCSYTTKKLDGKDINYEYYKLENLEKEEQQEYIGLAQEAGNMNFPIIINNGKSTTLEEVI